MTLVQLARSAGATVHAVRYYVRLGLIAPVTVGSNGYRHFDTASLKRLIFIRRAQSLGFTLDEIGEFAAHARHGRSPCPNVRRVLDERLPQIASSLEEAGALLERMQQAQRRWKRQPDGLPDGDAVCLLIESEPFP